MQSKDEHKCCEICCSDEAREHDSILDVHLANLCHGNLKTVQSYANPKEALAGMRTHLQNCCSRLMIEILEEDPQMPSGAVKLTYGLILTCGVAGLALAQESAAQQPSARPQRQRIHTPQSIDEELARLTKDLQLTPQQQQQVRPLLEEHHNKIQELLDKNSNASRQELGPQIHAISEETHREIHALLSNQQQQLEKAMQRREHQGEENRRPAPPAAASPAP
jgi:protein CpxP